jgi:hypothetical protein
VEERASVATGRPAPRTVRVAARDGHAPARVRGCAGATGVSRPLHTCPCRDEWAAFGRWPLGTRSRRPPAPPLTPPRFCLRARQPTPYASRGHVHARCALDTKVVRFSDAARRLACRTTELGRRRVWDGSGAQARALGAGRRGRVPYSVVVPIPAYIACEHHLLCGAPSKGSAPRGRRRRSPSPYRGFRARPRSSCSRMRFAMGPDALEAVIARGLGFLSAAKAALNAICGRPRRPLSAAQDRAASRPTMRRWTTCGASSPTARRTRLPR